MKTTSHIIVTLIALLLPAIASANIYENRVKEALENIAQKAYISNIGLTYSENTDPETGGKDGELRISKFKLGRTDFYLIDQAVTIYQQIKDDSKSGTVPYLYTLWVNTANEDRTYSGINLYYSHENSILVGDGAENCYTVGFYLSENEGYRHTYTLEWSNTNGDSVKGRVITTFGPVASKTHTMKVSSGNWSLNDYGIDTDTFNAQMEKLQAGMERFNEGMSRLKNSSGTVITTSSLGAETASSWMKKLLFYLDKIQRDGNDSRYIYLSNLYELCKNTDGLDQQDLKIALQQVATTYNKLKSKKLLTENELLFLQSMADVLQAKIQ